MTKCVNFYLLPGNWHSIREVAKGIAEATGRERINFWNMPYSSGFVLPIHHADEGTLERVRGAIVRFAWTLGREEIEYEN